MKSFNYAIYFSIITFWYSPHENHIQENKYLSSCQCYVLGPYFVMKNQSHHLRNSLVCWKLSLVRAAVHRGYTFHFQS